MKRRRRKSLRMKSSGRCSTGSRCREWRKKTESGIQKTEDRREKINRKISGRNQIIERAGTKSECNWRSEISAWGALISYDTERDTEKSTADRDTDAGAGKRRFQRGIPFRFQGERNGIRRSAGIPVRGRYQDHRLERLGAHGAPLRQS